MSLLTGQAELCVHLEPVHALPEHLRRNDMNLIKEEETPFPRAQKLHHLLGIVSALAGLCDHRVGRNYDPSRSGKLNSISIIACVWTKPLTISFSDWVKAQI